MPVHDRLGRDDYALLRGAMHAGLAAIAERFVVSADAPALARGACRNVMSVRKESKRVLKRCVDMTVE